LADLAPHAARLLLRQGKHRSTLDHRVQTLVRDVLRRQVVQLRERHLSDAAALVVDNRTAEVLAYVGSVGDLSSSGDVDGI
jgi:penicillin-binding protein 1C